MAKSKWLLLNLDRPQREALKALSSFGFTAGSGRGFELLSRSSAAIHSRFIERIVTREIITDPFGEVTELEAVRYTLTFFRLHAYGEVGNYLLEISAPQRTVRPLISALGDAFGAITVGEVEWPILDIYKRVKKDSPRAKIVRLRASGIAVSDASEAKVEVVSLTDALADYCSLFPKAIAKIEKIRIERPFLEEGASLELTSNGLCSFDESIEELVRALILRASE